MGVVILLGAGELLGKDSAAGSDDDIVSALFRLFVASSWRS